MRVSTDRVATKFRDFDPVNVSSKAAGNTVEKENAMMDIGKSAMKKHSGRRREPAGERRDFLKLAGKAAVVTPPAMSLLLSTSLDSEAIAGSDGKTFPGQGHTGGVFPGKGKPSDKAAQRAIKSTNRAAKHANKAAHNANKANSRSH
jgi:hypothetical protein